MYKRGYINGEKVLEIVEGNLDVVLYNEAGTSFYFYRFPSESVFKEKLPSSTNVVSQIEMKKMLAEVGIDDYEGLIASLIQKAWDTGMTERYEM